MQRYCISMVLALLIGLIAIPTVVCAQNIGEPSNVGKKIAAIDLIRLDGSMTSLQACKGREATVVVFFSFECPVATSYTSYLTELARSYADKGVSVLGICPSDEQLSYLQTTADDFKISFALFADPKKTVARALRAEITPEAFVLDADLVVRYRGRIDDAYSARLKRNAKVTSFDLRDALEDVLANRVVKVGVTKAVGCPIVVPTTVAARDAKLTYHRDVAPILQRHCQTCHRPGEIGPFALLTYRQAKNWSADIKEYTQSRKMPPWMPTAGESFKGERKLSLQEIATLAAWVDAGAPEGDVKDAPPPLKYADGWRKGPPDLILSASAPFHLAGSGRDLFRCFVVPTNLTDNQWVIGYDVRPGNPRVVHHTLHFFDASGTAQKLQRLQEDLALKQPKKADYGPGYSVAMGVGFSPPLSVKGELPRFGGIGGWAPGQGAQFVPEGTGWFLPKGSDFIIQVHYHRDGKPADDKTQVGLYFAKKPVAQPWQTIIVNGMQPWEVIPAGAAKHVARGFTYLQKDALLHSVMPHMHLLGKSVKVTMTPPAGSTRTLIEIGEWDYKWQETYWFKKPIIALAGTKLQVEAIFDNSAQNPNNPHQPPIAVKQGEQTTNEMLFAFIGATSRSTPWEKIRFGTSPPASVKGATVASEGIQVLQGRVGTWNSETTIKPAAWTPLTLKLTGTDTTELALGGRYLQVKTKPDGIGASTMQMVTFDAQKKTYRLWHFDDQGTNSEMLGQWDPKAKTMTWTGGSPVPNTHSTLHWRWVDQDRWEWDFVLRDSENKLLLDMTGKLVRKK